MAINAKHSFDDDGFAPDADAWVGKAIGQAWLKKYYVSDKDHAVEGTTFRFSLADGCTRALAFYLTDTPESNVPDEAAAWVMGLGTIIHESVQEVLVDAFPGCEVEVKVMDPAVNGSGHIDVVIDDPERESTAVPGRKYRTVIEIKTVGGFKFKLGASGFKGPPEGPSRSHITQIALAANALDADEAIVVWLARENIGAALAKKYADDPVMGRFTAQWTLTRDQYLPYVKAEHKRIVWVNTHLAENDGDPFAVTPYMRNNDDVVTQLEPGKGMFTTGESAWACDYCRYQDTCLAGKQ